MIKSLWQLRWSNIDQNKNSSKDSTKLVLGQQLEELSTISRKNNNSTSRSSNKLIHNKSVDEQQQHQQQQQKSYFKKGLRHWKQSKVKKRKVKKDNDFENDNFNTPQSSVIINDGDSLNIPKTDENWIRIQVAYNNDNIKSSDYYNSVIQKNINGSTISEISVDYYPSLSETNQNEIYYRENPVDVPEDFINKLQISKSNEFRKDFRESIQESLKEDWTERNSATARYSLPVPKKTPYNENYDEIKLDHFTNFHQIKKIQQQKMGVICVKQRKRAIAPANCEILNSDEQCSVDKKKLNDTDKPLKSLQSSQVNKINQIPEIRVYSNNIFDSSSPSTIELNNILYRQNNVNDKKYSNITNTKSNEKINTQLKINNKMDNVQINRIKKHDYNRRSQNFLQSFNGSVQNLMNFVMMKSNNNETPQKCVSENNLSNFSNSKLNSKINKFSSKSSTDLNYCPSVLYSRKQIAANQKSSEKSLNLKNIKKVFNLSWNKRLKDENHDTVTAFTTGIPESDERFQDLDGGFFEKFGSLLRQKSQLEEKSYTTPLAPLPEEEIAANVSTELSAIKETENDSGIGISHDSDNEQEQDDPRAKHESFIEGVVGMNIDELYEEVLFEILHNVGCEASEDVSQNALFEYVQDAFKIPNTKHDEMLQSAQNKEPPEIRLNVEVIKAENLVPKDSNGFSDPFVTLYLESCSTHRYNTSVKSETLNPNWEEHFSLPIPDNPNNEVLIVEVWDFDAAETVGEKMNKLFEVKGVRGLRKLMKEIAVTASTGKHDNELIGRTAIPLKTIPASGIKVWYSLEKGSKIRTRGSVLIRMSFSAEKNTKVAAQEHRHLLRILLMHELETSKVTPYWWNGKFSVQGEAVLTQHSAQSGLTQNECALAEWSVFSNIHQDHPLSLSLFITILDKIVPILQTLPNQDDEIRIFWEGARKLLPSCFSIIRKLRKKTSGDKHCVKMLSEVLEILSKISMLEPPQGFDLLPKQIYGWSIREDDGPNWDLYGTLRDAVNTGANEWFEHIDEGSGNGNASEEDKLQHLIKLIQLIRSDLQKAVEYYDKIFQQKMHFLYAQTLYNFYGKKLAEHIQPVVEEVCRNLKRISISEERFERLPEHEEINMGTTLFELYLVIKRFATLGLALCPEDENLEIYQYYDWFTPGVTHWLDISVYKAMTRIEKAIDLDKLIPVDETVKYSSSAVDTLAIFYQIKVFWQQLEWPDIVGAYTFVAKIADDICRCCVFYANRMSKRVVELRMHENQQRFEVTREWCLAINNIDYIRQSLPPFIKELGVDNIISRLGEFRSTLEAERCETTLKNVIENAIDTEKNKILELIEFVARKMSPAMRRFLIEGAEILHEDSNSMERLMMYLEESLQTLHTELNEPNFNRMLEAIWNELSAILYELVQSNLDKRRPPAFFQNLRDTLHVMVSSFKIQQNSEQTSSDKETLEQIERLLELHAFETADLIHQYYLERLNDQKQMEEKPYGQLTVKANFVDNILKLEIMNARNLIPMDSNGTCDSFVKVHFMPADKFIGISSPKTSVQHKTLYPLYDEKFSVSLTNDQRSISNAIIIFSIKDKDLFGMSNQYIAECYLSFNDVEESNNEQIHLTLSRPEYKDTDCIRALEYRQGDKQAKEFIKKLKQKAY